MKGILLPKSELLHGKRGLLKFSVRLNSTSLTSHSVTLKWCSRKLLLAWLLPSVWVISCLSRRASLGHSGWFSTLHHVKRKGALGTSLCTQNKQSEHISKSMLCCASCLLWSQECCEMLYYGSNRKDEADIILSPHTPHPPHLQKLHYKLTTLAVLCLQLLPQPPHFNGTSSRAGELQSMESSVRTD